MFAAFVMVVTFDAFFPPFFIKPGVLSMELVMSSRVTRSRREPPQQDDQARARWTTSLTKILADLMINQVQKGNRQKNSFSKKAWRYISAEFYKKTGLKWDKEQLKNRYAVLRRQYITVKSLLDQSDFSWDEFTGTIIAKDEAWTEYIRGHPDAETLKHSGCPIYKELCLIFSESAANGKHDSFAEDEGGSPSIQCADPLSMHPESMSDSDEVDDIIDDHKTTQPTTPCSTANRKRGRKGMDDVIAGAIMEMAAASKLRTAAMLQCNARHTIADCIRELDEMQGVDEKVYLAALDLFNKPNAREIFLSLKGDKRLIWLHSKCAA
ncbi:L10-interacting MYB domain-containing protein-like isoform X1 [Quercus lobata]|uniref:Myb/SANT-like domain-containing protein n=2 Tax=Quercus TaxID=3511 RepID=A0A7N2M0S8_QUELO|nr:L10-interacting MYB domain-containing protein-like isoform X1 [Quercus lobata]